MRKRKLRVLPRGTISDVHGLSPRKEKKKDKRVVMNIYINSDIFCFTAKNGSLIFSFVSNVVNNIIMFT